MSASSILGIGQQLMERLPPCPCQSGKPFRECHGGPNPPPPIITPISVDQLELAKSPITLKLDLACGQTPREGFEGVDRWAGAKHVVNLMQFPWPWADSSVAEIHCSHFVEHLPAIEVDEHGNQVPYGQGQDLLFRFFEEIHRVLVPDGLATIIVPATRSDRAFQDPTHRRYLVENTFAYLSEDWRKSQKLDHYNVRCNFASQVNTTCLSEINTMHPEAQNRHMRAFWNSVFDHHAILKAIKPRPKI